MKRLKRQLCAALTSHASGQKTPIPEAGRQLFDAFCALSVSRSYNHYGPNPISWSDLAAWSRISGTPLAPKHAEIIMAMDAVWLDHAYRKDQQAPEGVKTLPPISEHPLTAALFDVSTA